MKKLFSVIFMNFFGFDMIIFLVAVATALVFYFTKKSADVLISRTPYPAPTVKLNPNVKNFYDFTTDDLIVENYQTWPQIKNIPIAI